MRSLALLVFHYWLLSVILSPAGPGALARYQSESRPGCLKATVESKPTRQLLTCVGAEEKVRIVQQVKS